jgi:uncharacterized protein
MVRLNGHRLLAMLVGALLIGPPARAQDAARLQAAHRVLDASGSVNVMIAAVRANLPAQRAAAPKVPDEFWTRFEARMVQDAPQLVDSIAVIYARSFSVEDLQALLAFYTSPVGQRLRDLLPSLVTQSGQIGQRWGARIGAEVGASLQH